MSEGLPGRKNFPWVIYWLILAAISVLALWPAFSVLLAALVADANGCSLDEGSIHPCMVMGSDWGETLYAMGVMGWLMLATLPLGLFAFVGWLVALIAHRVAFRFATRQQSVEVPKS